jgi:hypothetical protein
MIPAVMGAARYWDDPDADLEETTDLPLPPDLRAELGTPPPPALRVLEEVISALRMVGVVLAVGGLGVIFANLGRTGRDFIHIAVPFASLAVIPGALYLVAAEGLVRRRYWAWVMSLLVTVVLMVAILGVGCYLLAVLGPRRAGPSGEINASGYVCPTLLYFSMPSLILLYMVRALPVIREAELLTSKGFNVLPPVPVQPLDSSDEPSPTTSRGPAPPAPWPPTRPRPS